MRNRQSTLESQHCCQEEEEEEEEEESEEVDFHTCVIDCL